MIKYELAKQLKDAGFANGEMVSKDRCKEFTIIGGEFNGMKEFIFIPTLSELIEACGDNFKDLTRDDSLEGKIVWTANLYKKLEESMAFDFHDGATPEEAVAKLWLAIHKK